MATEFICSIKTSGGDYTTWNAWDVACDCDLTAATTKVFAISNKVGVLADGDAVTGQTSGATGTLLHYTATQALISGISGTFQSETVQKTGDASKTFDTDDIGDSAHAVAEMYDVDDTTAVDLSGWTTGPENKVICRAATGYEHGGSWNGDVYNLIAAPAGIGVLLINTAYAVIDGLQIYHNGGSPATEASAILVKGPNAADHYSKIEVKNCICRGGRYPFRNGDGSYRCVICENVIAYGGTSGGIVQNTANGIIMLDNCVGIGAAYGIYLNGYGIVRNCYAYGSTQAYYNTAGITELLNAASSDNVSGTAALRNIAYSTDNFVNVTPGSEDLHHTEASALRDVGYDLSGKTEPHFDVSSVCDYVPNNVTGCIVELTNGSKEVVVKFREFETPAWLSILQKTFEMQYSFSGSTTKIAILSDTHIGSAGGTTELETAINDIDDVLGDISKVFVLGDVATDGQQARYDDYLTERNKSDIAGANWHELPGNHDNDACLETFKTKLSIDPVYYTVAIGNIVFCLLGDDNGDGQVSSDVTDFLETTLENNQDKNIFILTHQGRFATTRGTLTVGANPGYLGPIATIETDLLANNWDAWFCGHAHGWDSITGPNELCYYQGDATRTDIDGETRTGDWDVGADEYGAAGGISMPLVMLQHNHFDGGAIQ